MSSKKIFLGNNGVYMSVLNTCLWTLINLNIPEEMFNIENFPNSSTDIMLIFSKSLMYNYDYYLNNGWYGGVKNFDTYYKNKFQENNLPLDYHSNSAPKNGIEYYFINNDQYEIQGRLEMEVIFTSDISLDYLQEIWVKDIEKFKSEPSIPKKYKDMAVSYPEDIKCRHYNKFCIGKDIKITVDDCRENCIQNLFNARQRLFKAKQIKEEKRILPIYKIFHTIGILSSISESEINYSKDTQAEYVKKLTDLQLEINKLLSTCKNCQIERIKRGIDSYLCINCRDILSKLTQSGIKDRMDTFNITV